MSSIADVVQHLLGCAWGRTVMTADDLEECPEQAVRIIVLHDGPIEREYRVCAKHEARILQETVPHADPMLETDV